MIELTVKDLIGLGAVEEEYRDGEFNLKWRLSDLISINTQTYQKPSIFSFLSRKSENNTREKVRNEAYEDLEKRLKDMDILEKERNEILELKAIKEGKPQDNIKIIRESTDSYTWFGSKIHVRKNINFIESISIDLRPNGEHIIVRYDCYKKEFPICDYSHSSKEEIYHDQKKAEEVAIKSIQEHIKSMMNYYGMDGADKVQFKLVEKKH